MKTVKVTSKGQVTLPRALREKLNIVEGIYLEATIYQNGILLKPVSNSSHIIREHCRQYRCSEAELQKTRQILSKVPYSLSEQNRKMREE